MSRQFHRTFFFTKTPLQCWYRYNDEFQIYPCSYSKAPNHSNTEHFPNILEFWTNEDEKPIVSERFSKFKDLMEDNGNTIIVQKRILSILTCFTNNHYFNYPAGKFFWGIPFPEEIPDVIDSFDSQWMLNMYHYIGLPDDLKGGEFTQCDEPRMRFVEHWVYYQNNPMDDKHGNITMPSTIRLTLESYYSQKGKVRDCIDSAVKLLNDGIQTEPISKSLSLIAYISSIETIVNLVLKTLGIEIKFSCDHCQAIAESPYQCPNCGRPIWGIKQTFLHVLGDLISNNEYSQKKFKKFYDLRSRIVHNGRLVYGDNIIDWGELEKAEKDWMTLLEIRQLSRLCIVHWLLKNKGS